jgi:hypothetical protein
MLFSLLIVLPLTVVVWVLLRLFRARRLSTWRDAEELATKSIAAGLAGAVMLGMAILVPTTLIFFVLSTFDLSGWRALPVFLWGTLCLICGIGGLIAGLFDVRGRPPQGSSKTRPGIWD